MESLLKKHSSRPYNPLIANAFFRAGEIEAWGRGIQKIFNACQEAGVPEPVITYASRDIWIEFPFASAYLKIIPAEWNERLDEKLNDQLNEKLNETLGSTRAAIVQSIRNNPKITISQIAEQLQMSRTGVP